MDPHPTTPHPIDPAAAPQRGLQTWQVLAAIAVGSFLGVVVVCGGGVALTMLVFQQQITGFNNLMSGNFGTLPNLNYTLSAPADVVAGQPFEIELTLENTGAAPMDLYSLNDYSNLTLTQSDPPWQSYSGGEMIYQMPLPPGQPVVIKLTAQTQILGSQTLNIDAHTDNAGMSWAAAYGTINVVSATSSGSSTFGPDPMLDDAPAVTVTPP